MAASEHRASSTNNDYDERIYHRGPPPSRIRLALIMIAVLIAGTYLAVTKELPFKSHYELNAVFENAVNVRKGSPVRIAGVTVGEVRSVRGVGDAAEVTFTVDSEGRPVGEDSTVRIRPRIFLEGNFFLDLRPGTPGSPELPDEGTIPVTQTSTAVQLDEILTSLQAPSRENLVELLEGYGTGLSHIPTAAEDRGQDPAVHGKTGAESINLAFRHGGNAGRDTAITNEALLGTEPHDLSDMITSTAAVSAALLVREQQLADLVTNFNATSRAFASESENLGATVRELGPTLKEAGPALLDVDRMLPELRGFARDIEPGVAELPATIVAADPWLAQARLLLGPGELAPVAHDLRLAAPGLALTANSGLKLFSAIEATSRCVDQVLLPTGDVQITDAFGAGVPNYKEFFYATAGFAGESQNADGNGSYVRFQSGGGPVLTRMANPNGGFENDFIYGNTIEPPQGSQPALGPKPPFETGVPCSANSVPDLNGPAGEVGPATPVAFP